MNYAREILNDAENWITPKEFKEFWDSQGIVIGKAKLNKVLREVSTLKNSDYYIIVFGSIKNRRIHKERILSYIGGERI